VFSSSIGTPNEIRVARILTVDRPGDEEEYAATGDTVSGEDRLDQHIGTME